MNPQDRIAELEAQIVSLQSQLDAKDESLLEYVIPTQEFYKLLDVCKEDSLSKSLA